MADDYNPFPMTSLCSKPRPYGENETLQITDDNWSDGSLEPEDNDDADFDDDFGEEIGGAVAGSSPKRQRVA